MDQTDGLGWDHILSGSSRKTHRIFFQVTQVLSIKPAYNKCLDLLFFIFIFFLHTCPGGAFERVRRADASVIGNTHY